jgi:hypothetical protein
VIVDNSVDPDGGPVDGGRRITWDAVIDKFVDIPWGILVLIALVIFMATHVFQADDVRAFATAAGLLGVGHGIHTGAKNLANRPNK